MAGAHIQCYSLLTTISCRCYSLLSPLTMGKAYLRPGRAVLYLHSFRKKKGPDLVRSLEIAALAGGFPLLQEFPRLLVQRHLAVRGLGHAQRENTVHSVR